MSKDFRASQIQTTQIISSGSSSTNASIVFYSVDRQDSGSPNQGIIDTGKFDTSSIGSDIFVFFSGSSDARGDATNGIVAFGGDVHISGNLSIDGNGGSPWVDEASKLRTTASVAISSDSNFANDIGEDSYFYVSGGIGVKDSSVRGVGVFGGDVHISGNLTSDQPFGNEINFFRMSLLDFDSTEQTGSNPKVVGQITFPANEFSGSLTLRAILSNTDAGGVATVKLYNLETTSFVEIAGPSQTELSVTGTTPTLVESVNLFEATNFNTSSSINYELQLFSSTGSNTAQAGGAEFRPSGSFTGLTIVTESFTTTFVSGTTGFRIGISEYVSTTATSSNPEIAGQAIFPANEFSGSLTFRAVLSTISGPTTASVRLFNATSGAYVELQSGQDALTTVSTNPTIVTSQDLYTAINFDPNNQAVYEVHAHTSDAASQIIVGGAEFRPSGTFTPNTITNNNTIYTSGSWVDGSARLRTTASVAISTEEQFANELGNDVFFYVSGTTGNPITGKKLSVFGGDVRVSGVLTVGTGSLIIEEDRITFWENGFASSSIRHINNELKFFDTVNQSGYTLSELGSGGGGGFFFSNTADVIETTGSVQITGSVLVSNTHASINEAGSNVRFFVSGTQNSWTTGSFPTTKAVSVFGGDVRISGSTVGGNNNNVADDYDSFAESSQAKYNVIVGGENNLITVFTSGNLNGGTLYAHRNFIGAGLNNTITQSSNAAIVAGEMNEIYSPSSGAFIGGGIANQVFTASAAIVAGEQNYVEAVNGGILAGKQNYINYLSRHSVVVGGFQNGVGASDGINTGISCFVGAGQRANVYGNNSAVVAGNDLVASGNNVFVGAGYFSEARETESGIVSGRLNLIEVGATRSFIGAGSNHFIDKEDAAVVAGTINYVEGIRGFIGAGTDGWVKEGATDSAVIAGQSNYNDGIRSLIAIGSSNVITRSASEPTTDAAIIAGTGSFLNGARSFIGGGGDHILEGPDSAILGGALNNISTGVSQSAILGGGNNAIASNFSFAIGRHITIPAGQEHTIVLGSPSDSYRVAVSASRGVTLDGNTEVTGTLRATDDFAVGTAGDSFFVDSTAKRAAVGTTTFTYASRTGEFVAYSDDTAGSVANVLLHNPGTSNGLPFIALTRGSNQIGTISGRDSAAFGLANGITFTVTSGRDIGFRFGTTQRGLWADGGLQITGTLDASSNISTNRTVTADGGLSGSLTTLADGTPYLLAGANTTLTTESNGAITIASTGGGATATSASLLSNGIVDYASTVATSSSPASVGQIIFNAEEYVGDINLRAVLSNIGATTTSSIKLLNVTSGSFVHIGGDGGQQINAVGTTPTIITSSNLRNATNFASAEAVYELQLFTSNELESAFIGSAEFRTAGILSGSAGAGGGGGEIITFSIANYATTTNTSSLPQTVGQARLDPSRYTSNFYLGAILTAASASVSASIKLLNLDDQQFVEIGGSGVDTLSSVGVDSSWVTSVELTNAAGFNSTSGSNYELQLFTSNGSIPVILGGAVFEVTGTAA